MAQAEQLPDGDAGELAAQVVERAVQSRARRRLAAREPAVDLVERPGIVAERVRVRLHVGERRSGGLLVPLDRRRLAVADDVAVAELDLDDLGPVGRLARDPEGLGEREPDDACRDVHPHTLNTRQRPATPRGTSWNPRVDWPARACSSGDRACASGAQGRRFESFQAHRAPFSYAEPDRLSGSGVPVVPWMLAASPRPRCSRGGALERRGGGMACRPRLPKRF